MNGCRERVKLTCARSNTSPARTQTQRGSLPSVAHSLGLIETNSGMGTPVQGGRVRRYPVPRIGHGFDYRQTREGIKIVRWYRQSQQLKR